MFLLLMATGSILGAFIGGQFLGTVPSAVLLPGPTLILVIPRSRCGGTRDYERPACNRMIVSGLLMRLGADFRPALPSWN